VDEIAYSSTNRGSVWTFTTAPAVQLPAPWQSQDIGGAVSQSSAIFNNGLFSVAGGGADIWGTSDAFRFAYLAVTGNCTITARVLGVQNTDAWAKAGVMIRASLSANSAHAFVAVTPGNGVAWQYRATTGGTSSNNNTNGMNAPYWVRLVRNGTTFTGFRSPDGLTWTQIGSTTISMGTTVYAGLAVTAHNSSALCTATFDNVTTPGWSNWTVPPVPAGLSGVAGAGQVALTWLASSNATSYMVKRATTNGGSYSTVASVTTANCTDTGLSHGTTYYYVVSAMNPAGESSNSTPASVTTLSPTLGSLVHRYSFNETGGSTVADSVGGPVWTGTLPNGGTLAGGQLTLLPGSQQYARLPAGVMGSFNDFTVMAWVNQASVSYWSRVFDFWNSGTVHLFLTPQCGDGTLRFEIMNGGGAQQINCNATMSVGAWHQVVVTLTGTTGILYLDGIAVGSNTSLTITPASLGATATNCLGKSEYSNPYLDGALDEFRIYNVGLSAAEIAATAALGPDELLNPNSPQLSLAVSGTNLLLTWPVAHAGFTVQSRTNLVLGDWDTVTSPAPQIVGSNWQVSLPVPAANLSTFYRLLK
jgi:hypothetical protein